eukprot:CAMPEP_0176460320 /NCGR_PEP_ID=MMETSP0127-20121128/33900_1 /TAXON_ID=938130 /ORGANISM="Platyophrya macrostoma, Strain WH" /LENGTH=438 /DNA_ID=CAMNT_0017851621 /DNA_START=550 /DNA_END=1866 /DNA_ORIENTATION=+
MRIPGDGVIPLGTKDAMDTEAQPSSSTQTPEQQVHAALSGDMKLWLSIFAALSSLGGVGDQGTKVRAVECLFDIIDTYGSMYSTPDWQMILGGTIYPIFENILCDIGDPSHEADEDHSENILLLSAAMRRAVGLFTTFHSVISSHIGELLDVFMACSGRGDHETLVQLGFKMTEELVEGFREHGLADAMFWTVVQKRLRELGNRSCQAVYHILMRPVGAEGQGYHAAHSSLNTLKGLCVCASIIANADSNHGDQQVPFSLLQSFTAVLRRVIEESTEYLDSPDGLDNAIVGNLIATEEAACSAYLDYGNLIATEEAACSAYLDLFSKVVPNEEEESQFYATVNHILSRVCPWSSSVPSRDAGADRYRLDESNAMAAVVVAFLSMTESFSEQEFDVMLHSCYDGLVALIAVCHPDVSREVANVMQRAKSRLTHTVARLP